MPMQRELYPDDWEAIAYMVKEEAKWRCEECGRPCRRPDESEDTFASRLFVICLFSLLPVGQWWEDYCEKPRRNTLTVAHLDHKPRNCDRSNLKALCIPCHCRYDLKAMGTKQQLKLERGGQLRIEGL